MPLFLQAKSVRKVQNGSPVADPYMCMADFAAYNSMQHSISELYSKDKLKWNQMSLRNISAAGIFAADQILKISVKFRFFSIIKF